MRKNFFIGCALAVSALFTVGVSSANAQLFISEVMPDPASERDLSEWVEVVNYSDSVQSLVDWKLGNMALSSIKPEIAAGEALVITKNLQAFLSEFGEITAYEASSLVLSNQGSTLELRFTGELIDHLTYSSVRSQQSWERMGPLCTELVPGRPHSVARENPSRVSSCYSGGTSENYSGLKINEYLPDPEGHDAGKEWIEIINESSERISLGGVSLKTSSRLIHTFTSDQFIDAGKILLINLESAVLLNCSQPSTCTEQISLVAPTAEIINMVSYDDSLPGKSWSRTSEDTWTMNYPLSPGALNQPPTPVITTLLISEVHPYPSSGEQEWLELYNFGGEQIDLTGWLLRDLQRSHSLAGVIGSRKHLVVNALRISLNNDGDTIDLISPEGELIDRFVYSEVTRGMSLSREWEDTGYSDYSLESIPTPGVRNITDLQLGEDDDEELPTESATLGVVAGPVLPIHEYKMPELSYDSIESTQPQPKKIELLPTVSFASSLFFSFSYLLSFLIPIFLRVGRTYFRWWLGG